MTMLSKCSVVATLAALTLSLGAGAMSQSSQLEEKACKKEKTVLECPTEVQKLCDQFQQIDVGQSISQSAQVDVGSSCGSSSQAQFGACITQDACTHQASAHDQFAQHVGPKQVVKSWYANKSQVGHHAIYQNWSGSQWDGVRLENAHFRRIMNNGSTLNNVWVHGKFRHWKFDGARITNSTFSGKFRDVDFRDALLQNVDFVQANFKQKHLHRSNFDGATLRGVRFIKSKLSGMTFRHAQLEDVSFECTSLEELNCFIGARVLLQDGRWHKVTAQNLRDMGAKVKCGDGALINFTQFFHH